MNFDEPLNDLKCKVDALGHMFDCPICFQRLSDNVPLCTQGHHLCQKCRTQITQCPFCQSKFNGARNYCVEDMVTKFDEMKRSLGNLSVSRNILHVAKKKKTDLPVVDLVVEEGEFPCGGYNCRKSLSFCDMINHIKTVHKEIFTDVGPVKFNENGTEMSFTKCYELFHSPSVVWNFILHIHNMGIFFLKLDSDTSGKVHGYVEMVSSASNAQYFNYSLKMGNDDHVIVFRGQVKSTTTMQINRNHVPIADLLFKSEEENSFYLWVTITYAP